MIDPKKVVQSNDIATELIKSFSKFFSDYININIGFIKEVYQRCLYDQIYENNFFETFFENNFYSY